MTEKQIEYILAIDKFKSISKAAESLGISQPYLSQFLSSLEDDLGYRLFDRSAFPISLTPCGEAYIETAMTVRNLEVDLKKRMDEINSSFTGKIAVLAPSHVCFGLMPKILKAFHANYPNYRVKILTDSVDDYLTILKTGVVDLLISAREFNDATIEAISTEAARLLVAAPSNFDIADENNTETEKYPLADLSKLKNYSFIIVKGRTDYINDKIGAIMGNYPLSDNAIIECDSYFLCTELVQEGLGVSIIPETSINNNVNSNLKLYSIPYREKPKNMYIYFRKNAYFSKAMETFINLIIQTAQTK